MIRRFINFKLKNEIPHTRMIPMANDKINCQRALKNKAFQSNRGKGRLAMTVTI